MNLCTFLLWVLLHRVSLNVRSTPTLPSHRWMQLKWNLCPHRGISRISSGSFSSFSRIGAKQIEQGESSEKFKMTYINCCYISSLTLLTIMFPHKELCEKWVWIALTADLKQNTFICRVLLSRLPLDLNLVEQSILLQSFPCMAYFIKYWQHFYSGTSVWRTNEHSFNRYQRQEHHGNELQSRARFNLNIFFTCNTISAYLYKVVKHDRLQIMLLSSFFH